MKEISYKDFSVFIGDDVFAVLAEYLAQKSYSKVFVLVDENTLKHCWPILNNYLVNTTLIQIKSGESNKNLSTAQYIWEFLQSHYADRRSVLINLGGGVLSDVGGFCAATYKRGIDFINIPTTLLGMVDAAVGGKQGVDVQSYKNAVGVFQNPVNVFIYPKFIDTLDECEIKNGIAELTKHALIADKDLWDKLDKVKVNDLEKIYGFIYPSLKIKTQITKKDPYEKGIRKVLNYGHTIGHALETCSLKTDKRPLKHGEAVVIGMICEAFISKHTLGLSNKELNQIVTFYLNRFEKYNIVFDVEEILNIMRNDKKNLEGNINFTLIKRIGKAKTDVNCPDSLIVDAIHYYNAL
ncbi:MAG: 3-dehydroquinate synthase [Bacteroidia bacterium]